MKVQLIQSVPSLGRAGEIVEVSDAQARNQLIPKKIAVAATTSVIAAHQRQGQAQRQRQAQRVSKITDLIRQIEGATVTLRGKANAQGKLFAAVKLIDIQPAMEKKFGLTLPGLRIEPDHLKTIGHHAVIAVIDNHHAVSININIEHGE